MHTEPSTLKLMVSEYRATKTTTPFVFDFLYRFLRLTSCIEKHVWFYSVQTVWFESGTRAAEFLTYSYVLFTILNDFHFSYSSIGVEVTNRNTKHKSCDKMEKCEPVNVECPHSQIESICIQLQRDEHYN